MILVNVNYIAVFVAAIVNMIIGGFWYSQTLFGRKWMDALGKSDADMQETKKGAWKSYVLTFVASFITAYVLALFLGGLAVVNAAQGIEVAFWIWIGFVITTSLGSTMFEKRQPWLYVINNGYELVSFIVMAIILVFWK